MSRSRLIRALRRDQRASAVVEFALSLPVVMLVGLGGTELANNIVTRKRATELAMMIADNASRMGSTVSGSNKQVREVDINDVFLGAQLASGKLDLRANGRAILYSLEQNASGGQWIHWGRCYGAASLTPSFTIGTGATGTSYAGMSVNGATVTATSTSAVMVVELVYDYRPILPLPIRGYGNQRISVRAAALVRDPRDLAQVYNPSPTATASSCS